LPHGRILRDLGEVLCGVGKPGGELKKRKDIQGVRYNEAKKQERRKPTVRV
jgi:hypothetical protein